MINARMDTDSHTTSRTGTSEGCVDAALKACAKIVLRLAPYVGAASSGARGLEAWAAIVAKAYAAGVDLSAGLEADHLKGGNYNIYTAACTEVELDVLTGQYTVLQADLVYDAGISLNPSLDIGQVEGCFVMAMGMCLSERQVRARWQTIDRMFRTVPLTTVTHHCDSPL
jgi:xanthine dehydrogenase molybdopterin-binding subunit B